MKSLLVGLLLLLVAVVGLSAQGNLPEIPEDYLLEYKSDYKPYEEDVIILINWLEETPVGENLEERALAKKFIHDWIIGSPYVSIALHQNVFESFLKEDQVYSSPVLLSYEFAMALAVLENSGRIYDGTELELQKIGIEKMYKTYLNFKSISKSRSMEKFGKLIAKGKLEKWIKQNVKF